MKITLDIPDGTVAAFFDFVYWDGRGANMQSHSIPTDELYDGAEIKIEAGPTKGGAEE